MVPLPPATFSTRIDLPRLVAMRLPSRRASVSVALPAAKGTTNFRFCAGYCACKAPCPIRLRPSVATMSSVRFMTFSLAGFCRRACERARLFDGDFNFDVEQKVGQRLAVAVEPEA